MAVKVKKFLKRHIRTEKRLCLILIILFIFSMTFVVDNNALELNKKKTKLERLQRVEEFLKIDIEKNRKTLKSINSSQSDLENYGREQFFMKRSDEDVYMVIER